MLTYGDFKILNVVVDFDELETAYILLSDPGAPFNPAAGRWELFANTIAGAMATQGMIHIIIPRELAPTPRPADWRPRLPNLQEPLRSRIEEFLNFFSGRYGVPCDRLKIELV
ncbi:MAG: hypothetical protein AAB692_01905 [Patescibacteria group bacterium]